MRINAAIILRLADEGHQLFLRDTRIVTAMKQAQQQLFPLGKEEIDRLEEHNEKAQQRGETPLLFAPASPLPGFLGKSRRK